MALLTFETSPTSLVVEVTENLFIDDNERVGEVLSELARSGIRIALDDYGTGYSSLGYLAHLPIHILKIDRCFIADLARPAGEIIVASVNKLAHDLGLHVVAEGVETTAQHDIINTCDLAQGSFAPSRWTPPRSKRSSRAAPHSHCTIHCSRSPRSDQTSSEITEVGRVSWVRAADELVDAGVDETVVGEPGNGDTGEGHGSQRRLARGEVGRESCLAATGGRGEAQLRRSVDVAVHVSGDGVCDHDFVDADGE